MKSAKLSKKIIAIALAACMLGGTAATGVGSYIGLSTTVNAAETTANGFEYDTNDDGTVTIIGYSGSDTELVIPSEIDGKKVTSIGESAFYKCTGFTSVKIGNGVTSIGESAFERCTGLTSVIIPDSVTSIGDRAFYWCTGLTSVTIPDSVTSIGDSAFYNCTGLTSVTIPDSVTSIGDGAFGSCDGLTSITIPDSVTSIGDEAFYWCTGLTSVTIPDSVTSIGYRAFANCERLTSVTIPYSVTSIGDEAFCNCVALTSVTIPDSVTSIGNSAFYSCGKLTSVIIGNGVTSIGNSAFAYCRGLERVTIPYGVTSIGRYAFKDCMILRNITIPDSVTSIGKSAFSSTPWCESKPDGLIYAGKVAYRYKGEMPENTNITLKDGTKGIAGGAFDSCKGLTSITIPDSVISMGDCAFRSCTGLTSIIIPDSVTSISDYAFYGCTGLTSITIPDSVTSIGYSAFAYCRGLTSITIPDSVTSIGDYAFGECYNLTIYGVRGSAAETYANENNISFVAINTLANNSTISATTITKGDSITLTGKATGSTSPYQYAFSVKHSTATKWTTIQSYGTTATKTWKPAYTGTYQVCAKVKDSTGTEVRKFFTLTVNAPLTNNSTISNTEITKGDSITLNAVATGGTAPYQYAFSVKHSTATSWTYIKTYNTTATKTWKPAKTGTYQVCAKVKDASGKEIKKFFTLTVNAPLTNNSTISKTTINKGDSVTLKAVATGGTSPYQYSFTVKHSTATSWTTIKSYSTTTTRNWTPAKTGTYQVCAKVKDASGTEVKKFFTLTIK